MTDRQHLNSEPHCEPEYIVKPLEIHGFTKGKCFLCGEACDPDFYAHYQCANQYDKKKREILDSFLKKDRKVGK